MWWTKTCYQFCRELGIALRLFSDKVELVLLVAEEKLCRCRTVTKELELTK